MRQFNYSTKLRKVTSLAGALFIISLLTLGLFVGRSNAAAPGFVQAKAREISTGKTNSVSFTSSNTAGNLIAVVVIWNNTGSVSLSDSRGNTYAAATLRTTWDASKYSAQVFYAKNIVGGSNTVKATFATSINSFAIVQAHEYSGLDKNSPLGATTGATGTGTAMSSGSLSAGSNELLFAGSGNAGAVSSIGSGFTGRVNTSGNRTMDKVVTTAGTYSATATGTGQGWFMQLVSFKTAAAADTTPPSVPSAINATAASESQVNLTWTAATDNVGVVGYKLFRGGSQIADISATSYQDNSLSANTTYSYTVLAYDAAGNQSLHSAAASVTTPAPPVSGGCLLPSYPSPACTGVPSGATFNNVINGDYTVTTSGQVIDGWHIKGNLLIMASNVTVKNSQIDGTVDNEVGTTHFTPFVITDTTIGPESGCIVSPGLGQDGYTATRVLIRGHDDGFRVSGNNITITDSYAKLCYADATQAPPDGSHSDGIQAYCPDSPCGNLVFNHNTVDAQNVPATFMINLVDSNLHSVTANDNLLAGGAYTIVTFWHSGPVWTLHNNRIVNNSWVYGPVSAEGTCANQDWSGNSIVTIDSAYNITGTVRQQPCVE